MGVVNWKIACQEALLERGIATVAHTNGSWTILCTLNNTITINLLDLKPIEQSVVVEARAAQFAAGQTPVMLWEDVWLTKQQQVLARIGSLVGINARIYARSCSCVRLGRAEGAAFIAAFHLQGAVKFKTAIGLIHKDKLVAVAALNMRPMPRKGVHYISAELVRFCTIPGYTITGGLSKLLNYFREVWQPADIMSYADKDWSAGNSYEAIKFTYMGDTPPLEFYVDPLTLQRYRIGMYMGDVQSSVKVFNTGNKKYVWIFNK